jgi:hypothetical protein
MLIKATSRSVVVVNLRCHGKGAIEFSTSTLQASGIVVSVAELSQRMTVVERMVRTLKGRFRCSESALPFIINLTLVVLCVVFYMHLAN